MQPINISMRYREFKYKFMDESYDIMEMPRKLNKDEVDQANTIDGIIKKIKGVKEIMYPGQNKDKRFRMNLKKEIKLSKIIQKDLLDLKN